MKKAYYYLFYKFYRMSEAAPSRWLSDWKAGVAIIVLELFFLASLFVYYKVFFNRYIHLGESNLDILIAVFLVVIPNYFAFLRTEVWKDYVREFDKLPKRTNRIGSWIVFGLVLFVLFNLIFSFYLMSQIDWSQYR